VAYLKELAVNKVSFTLQLKDRVKDEELKEEVIFTLGKV